MSWPSHLALACAALGGLGCHGGTDAAGPGGATGAGGAAAKPIIDPALFDCTRKSDPPRINTVPIGCATDPACTTRLVTAHRAAGGQIGVIAPENTLAAVRAGIAMGVDFIETDPRPTSDGVLVNMHDTNVDRTTDGTGDVDKMTFAALEKLHVVADQYPGDYSCERVPTITQLLAAARGKAHVLLDGNKTDRVDLFIDAIHQTDTLDWAIFDTSSPDKIDKALALEPKLYTMIRVPDPQALADQLAHFAAHPPVIVEIDKPGEPKTMVPAIHGVKNRASWDVFVVDLAAKFNPDPKLYKDVMATGIDIVETDRPDLLLKFLGRWKLP